MPSAILTGQYIDGALGRCESLTALVDAADIIVDRPAYAGRRTKVMTMINFVMSLFYGMRLLPHRGGAWRCAYGVWNHAQAKKCTACGAPRPSR